MRIEPLSVEASVATGEQSGMQPMMAELQVFRVLNRHPQVAKALVDLLGSMLFDGTLDPRLRELVIMRVGWATGSVYEWTQHWRIARLLGVEEADLLAVRGDWRDHPGFGPAERAALRAADDVVATGVVGAAAWADVEAAFPTPRERIELAMVIACWRMVATVLDTLEVPLDDGMEPWPPDGRAPR
jgi:4-carboxymuconolactone decarboxylase